MLAELFTGKTDLADWHHDPLYQAAKAAEEDARRREAEAYAQYDQLWRSAHPGGEIARLPPSGHPAWAARWRYEEAKQGLPAVTAHREEAERAAKETVRAVGEAAGRDKWAEAEREVFPRLIAWVREYEALRVEVREKQAVLLPEIASSCCFTADDLAVFCDNARRSFVS